MFSPAIVVGFAKSLGLSAAGAKIIAIGPKGGKIVGYDAKGEPVYAGSKKEAALVQAANIKAANLEDAPAATVKWLALLGIQAVPHAGGLVVGPKNGKLLQDAGAIPDKAGERFWTFSVQTLSKLIGKPLVPSKADELTVAAQLAAGCFGDKAVWTPEELASLVITDKTLGSHGGRVVNDAKGKRVGFWKTNAKGGSPEPWVSYAEEAAARVGDLLAPGLFQPSQVVNLKGVTGVLLRWVDGTILGKESSGHGVEDEAMLKHASTLFQHQVVDWLVSNHDSHGANFIVTESGKLVALDKGQAWKEVGKDKLSTSYKLNNSAPVYNHLWSLVTSGKVAKEDVISSVKKVFERLEKVSAEQFASITEPYVAALTAQFGKDAGDKKRAAIMDRFNSMRSDWEAFLGKELGTPVSLGGDALVPVTTVAEAPVEVPSETDEFPLSYDKAVSILDGAVVGTTVQLASGDVWKKLPAGTWKHQLQSGAGVVRTSAQLASGGFAGSVSVKVTLPPKPVPEPVAPPAPDLKPVQVPGWPITKGGVTVHHPGEPPPSGSAWPGKYGGPGFKADITYKKKTYNVEFSLGAGGVFAASLTLPDGKLVACTSPQNVADKIVLFEKGLPLDSNSYEIKKKYGNIGYSAAKLFKVDEFASSLTGAGVVDKTPDTMTVKELEDKGAVSPEAKVLTVAEELAALPDGEVQNHGLLPWAVMAAISGGPLNQGVVKQGNKLLFTPALPDLASVSQQWVWTPENPGEVFPDKGPVVAPVAPTVTAPPAPVPVPPAPVKVPSVTPKPAVPTSIAATGIPNSADVADGTAKGVKSIPAATLATLPAGTVIVDGFGETYTLTNVGMWVTPASFSGLSHEDFFALQQDTDAGFSIHHLPGTVGWDGPIFPTAADLALLPVGTILHGGDELSSEKLPSGMWSGNAVSGDGSAPGGVSLYCTLPGGMKPGAAPTNLTPQAAATAFPPLVPEVPAPAPAPEPAQTSILAGPQPNLLTTLDPAAPAYKTLAAGLAVVGKSPKTPEGIPVASKSPLWDAWVPPPGVPFVGTWEGKTFYGMTAQGGYKDTLVSGKPTGKWDGGPDANTKMAVIDPETGKVWVGDGEPGPALATALSLAAKALGLPGPKDLNPGAWGWAPKAFGLMDAVFPVEAPQALTFAPADPPPALAAVVPAPVAPETIPQAEKEKAVSVVADLESIMESKAAKDMYGKLDAYKPKPDSKNGKNYPNASYLQVTVPKGTWGSPSNQKDPVASLQKFIADHGLEKFIVKEKPPAISKFKPTQAWCLIDDSAFAKEKAIVSPLGEALNIAQAPAAPVGEPKSDTAVETVPPATTTWSPELAKILNQLGYKVKIHIDGKMVADGSNYDSAIMEKMLASPESVQLFAAFSASDKITPDQMFPVTDGLKAAFDVLAPGEVLQWGSSTAPDGTTEMSVKLTDKAPAIPAPSVGVTQKLSKVLNDLGAKVKIYIDGEKVAEGSTFDSAVLAKMVAAPETVELFSPVLPPADLAIIAQDLKAAFDVLAPGKTLKWGAASGLAGPVNTSKTPTISDINGGQGGGLNQLSVQLADTEPQAQTPEVLKPKVIIAAPLTGPTPIMPSSHFTVSEAIYFGTNLATVPKKSQVFFKVKDETSGDIISANFNSGWTATEEKIGQASTVKLKPTNPTGPQEIPTIGPKAGISYVAISLDFTKVTPSLAMLNDLKTEIKDKLKNIPNSTVVVSFSGAPDAVIGLDDKEKLKVIHPASLAGSYDALPFNKLESVLVESQAPYTGAPAPLAMQGIAFADDLENAEKIEMPYKTYTKAGPDLWVADGGMTGATNASLFGLLCDHVMGSSTGSAKISYPSGAAAPTVLNKPDAQAAPEAPAAPKKPTGPLTKYPKKLLKKDSGSYSSSKNAQLLEKFELGTVITSKSGKSKALKVGKNAWLHGYQYSDGYKWVGIGYPVTGQDIKQFNSTQVANSIGLKWGQSVVTPPSGSNGYSEDGPSAEETLKFPDTPDFLFSDSPKTFEVAKNPSGPSGPSGTAATTTSKVSVAPSPPPPPPPPKLTPEQEAAIAEKKAKAAEAIAKAKAYAAWVKENPKPTDKALLKALAVFQKEQGKKLYAHVQGKYLLVGSPQGSLVTPGAFTAESPMGPLLKLEASEFVKSFGQPSDITGPDGQSYPAGTTFQTKEVSVGSKLDAVKALPGFYKTKVHEKDPSLTVVKFSDSSTPSAVLASVKAVGLEPQPVFPGADLPVKGSAGNLLMAVPNAALAESAGTKLVVTPEVPPQLPAFSPAPPPFAVGPQPQGSTGVANDGDIDAISAIKPTEWGHCVRVGKPGVLFDPHLRFKKVRMQDGTNLIEVHGELATFSTAASKLTSGKMVLYATAEKNQYDANTGVHTLTDPDSRSYAGRVGETAGGSRVEVALSADGAARAFDKQFVVRIPENANVRAELESAFTLMGINPEDALATHDEDTERVWIKGQIVRNQLGHEAYHVTPREKYGDEAWLDAQIAKYNLGKYVDTAKVVVGAGGVHRVWTEGITDDDIQKANVRFVSAGLYNYDVVAHHLGQTQGVCSRRQGYVSGTKAPGDSVSSDETWGGSYFHYTRVNRPGMDNWGNAGDGNWRFIYHPRVLKRADFAFSNYDSFGKTAPGQAIGTAGRDVLAASSTRNEVDFVGGVDMKDLVGVMCKSESDKQNLLAEMKKKYPSVKDINGLPLEEFFFVAATPNGVATKCPGLKAGVVLP